MMGRRSYDNSIEAWGGKGPLGDVPCFVVTHTPPASADPSFTFVTDGIERALAKGQEVAAGKRIGLMGANIEQQFLAAGLVDEIRIHLVNVLLGGVVGCSTSSRSGSSWNRPGSTRPTA
jgi:dihydrofolate reductase